MIRALRDLLLMNSTVYNYWQAPFADAKVKPFLRYADPRIFRRVLDIGCGPGTNAKLFNNSEYIGVDINPRYIATASKHFRGQFILGDVSDERVLPEMQFDCIFANSLMHHLSDPIVEKLLTRIARMTTENGSVHILDLVLPSNMSLARVLARFDRGYHARSIDTWRQMFCMHLFERHFEIYSLGPACAPLWWMIYFVGESK